MSSSGESPRVSGYREGFRTGLVFGLACFVLAVSFGVLARDLGWGIVAPVVASIVIFSGSAQFAIANVLGTGGSVAAAVLAAILVNARFAPMSVAVASAMKGGRLRRALEAQANVDASWAIANRGGGRFDRELLLGATAPQAIGWIGGTIVGVLAGDAIGDPERLGLDVFFPAFFLGLLLEELRGGREHVAASALAAVIALALVPFTPPGVPIVAACVAALLGLRR